MKEKHSAPPSPALTLTTGALQLPVLRDGVSVGHLTLQPDDTSFLTRFYGLLPVLQQRQQTLADALQKDDAPQKSLAALQTACNALRGDIDEVFGAGTSQLVFGSACSLALVQQFFEGVAEALRQARAPLLAAYTQDSDGILNA